MPIEANFLEEYSITGYDEDSYSYHSGREIYDMYSISTLNKLPVSILMAFTTAGANWSNQLPVQLNPLIEALLVDGSVIMINNLYLDKNSYHKRISPDMSLLFNTEAISEDYAIEHITDKITRVYTRSVNTWIINDVEHFGTDDEKLIKNIGTMPSDAFYVYPNGKGILEPYQKTYFRLEEVEDTLRKQTTDSALTVIVGGNTGGDAEARKAQRLGRRILFFPDKDISVNRVADSHISDQLLSQQESLLRRYFMALHIVDIEANANLSGVARRLSMLPTLNFVDGIRTDVEMIMEDLGYTGKISWFNLMIMESEEALKRLELIRQIKNEINMPIEDFTRHLSELL